MNGVEYYISARYNFGPGYVGFQYGHSPGDDPDTQDKNEGGIILSGYDLWQPCLILYNDWLDRFAGNMGIATRGSSSVPPFSSAFNNADLYQIFLGYNPTPKLALRTSFTMVFADEKPVGCNPETGACGRFVDDEIGQEFDIQATYKLFDNLEYMIGFGYLWTGDFFKGADKNQKIRDDYLIIHQVSLTF